MAKSVHTAVICTTIIAVGAFALARGPLNPPAGPITQTDPDLAQILAAVQGVGAGANCCPNQRALPGHPELGTFSVTTLGSSPILEFQVGAENSYPPSGGAGGALSVSKTHSLTRISDRLSPSILVAVGSIQHFQSMSITLNGVSGNDNESFEFIDVVFTSICNEMVMTCDGPLHVEHITFEANTIEHKNDGVSKGWDFFNGVPL